MAWTQADVDALKSAIASGQMMVRSGDRMVQYRTLAEMREALSLMESEVAGNTSGLRIGGGRSKITFQRD